ncbi:MAG: YbjN domain-containing protein [Chlamydiia bacterium]|nr:YbjN domain-containing protein [Chlamydiia bacterium]
MADAKLSSLATALKELGHDASIQEETQQVFFSIKYQDVDFPVFGRMAGDDSFVQIIAFMPGQTTDKTVNDTSRLLHMINRELDMPGFCLDEQNKVAFYRVMVPAKAGNADKEALALYTKAIQRVVETFANLVFAVIMGKLSLEEVMKQAQQQGTP